MENKLVDFIVKRSNIPKNFLEDFFNNEPLFVSLLYILSPGLK
jgi:hypothetical protein